jgi:hypothetical protein
MEELEPIGVGIATVHSENEPLLVKKVGVSSLPLMVLLMDGKAMHYKESLFSVQKVVGTLKVKYMRLIKVGLFFTDYSLFQSLSEASFSINWFNRSMTKALKHS